MYYAGYPRQGSPYMLDPGLFHTDPTNPDPTQQQFFSGQRIEIFLPGEGRLTGVFIRFIPPSTAQIQLDNGQTRMVDINLITSAGTAGLPTPPTPPSQGHGGPGSWLGGFPGLPGGFSGLPGGFPGGAPGGPIIQPGWPGHPQTHPDTSHHIPQAPFTTPGTSYGGGRRPRYPYY